MEMEIKMKISEGREQRGERDIIILTRWRAIVALHKSKVTVTFRKCGEPLQRLLEHHFCGLALHIYNKEPNTEALGDALRQDE